MTILSFIESFSYLGSFILLVSGALGFPFPEGTILMANGFLIAGNVIRPVYAVMFAYFGIIIGDCLAYYLGKKYGQHILDIKFFRKIITASMISNLQKKFDGNKIITLTFLGHLLSGIFIIMGILKTPFSKFLIADAVVSIFAVAAWVGLGYIGGESFQVIASDVRKFWHFSIFLLIALVAVYPLFKRKKKWLWF
jgi:membrane protein DedA with SNARE-associated domain